MVRTKASTNPSCPGRSPAEGRFRVGPGALVCFSGSQCGRPGIVTRSFAATAARPGPQRLPVPAAAVKAAPTPYRQHHDVTAPQVDSTAFRQGWRVAARLDGLLESGRIDCEAMGRGAPLEALGTDGHAARDNWLPTVSCLQLGRPLPPFRTRKLPPRMCSHPRANSYKHTSIVDPVGSLRH
jgi:hypothetical protein